MWDIMGEIDSDKLYNELANLRKEIENINSRIDLIENRINAFSEFKKIPQKTEVKKETLLDYRDWISSTTEEEPQVTKVEKPQVIEVEEPQVIEVEEPQVIEVEEPQVIEVEEPQVIELEKIPVFEEKKEPFFDWKKISFEEALGKKWFSRIGIISIFIAMVLLLKDLYDRDLISPAAKIGIGIIMGLILLAAGEILFKRQYEKKYEYLARTITSGGIGILYL